MDLAIGGKTAFSGYRWPGSTFLSGPRAQTWRAVYTESFDHLRLYVDQSVMADCYGYAFGRTAQSSICVLQSCVSEDPALAHLGTAIKEYADNSHTLGPSFLDALGLSFASRLLWLQNAGRLHGVEQRTEPLVPWRLERVSDYIGAHLAKPIRLGELSKLVGLSQAYFSTQFRLATGMPPYRYILKRRIAVAEQLLLNTDLPIVEIALRLGFSSQQHFTEAFRRLKGEPPARWRSTV